MILIQYIWYYFFWLIVRIGLGFYFKRIKVTGIENVPKNTPVIFGANHENAFIDALLITTRTSRFAHYLVRADVFRNALVRAIFKSFNMLPVYRIRDGYGSLKSNTQIFESCYKALSKGRSLILFPEGKHDIRRVPRKLTKGISRIALGTINSEQPPKELFVVPVGLNYSKHKSFRSSVHIVYGKPIKVEESYSADELRKTVNAELLKCTIGLEEEYYDQLNTLVFKSEGGYDLSDPQPINLKSQQFSKQFKSTNSDGLFNAIEEFNGAIDELGAKNWKSLERTNKVSLLIMLIVLSPFYLYGLLQNLVAITIIETIIATKVEDKIFTSSIKFSIGLILFPLCWFLQSLWLWDYSSSIYYNIAYWLSIPASLLMVSVYHSKLRAYWARRKFDKDSELSETLESSLEYINRFKSKCG